MNFNEIENLARQSKSGDTKAKEKLINEFNPFILNVCKKSHINSFDFSDIKHECYKALLKSINYYNPNKQSFVGYATATIKNSINNLIRVSIRRNSSEGPQAYVLNDKLEAVLGADLDSIDDILFMEFFGEKLKSAIEKLTPIEQELVTYLYYKEYSASDYAKYINAPYSTVIKRRNRVLDKLKAALKFHGSCQYLN